MVKSVVRSSSRSKSLLAALVVATLGLGAVSPAALAETVSKTAAKTLKAAQDACNAKNYTECINKSKEALALPGKTAYDGYVANQFLAMAYARTGNNTEAANALEAQLDSGFVPAAQQKDIIKSLGTFAYQEKNYAKSSELFNRLIKNGGADELTYTMVAQSYFLQGKFSETGKFLDDYVGDQEKRGQTPKEQTLKLLLGAYDRADNKAGMTNALEKLVVYYPKKEYWNNLLYTLRRTPAMNDRQTLQVYRLMQATDTIQQGADYSEMAELAVATGYPGEAQHVLEQAFAAAVFKEQRDKDRSQRLLDSVKKSAATDQAGLAKQETDAVKAKTGDVDVALGTAYMSYGQNDKAVAALTRGIAKGGLKNMPDALLTLGIAQARMGNKAEALKTFRTVKTDDAVYQRLAKLWSLYVQ